MEESSDKLLTKLEAAEVQIVSSCKLCFGLCSLASSAY